MENDKIKKWMESLDFEFWSTAQHKIMPAQFFNILKSGEKVVLLDVRDSKETQYISLPFGLHIPINQLPKRLNEIPRDRLVATFCSGGDRAAVAFAYLRMQGFENVKIFKGGYGDLMAELMPGKLRQLFESES